MPDLRVLIFDPSPVDGRITERFVSRADGFTVAGVADAAGQIAGTLDQIDALIVDLEHSGHPCDDAMQLVAAAPHHVPVVVLSRAPEATFAAWADAQREVRAVLVAPKAGPAGGLGETFSARIVPWLTENAVPRASDPAAAPPAPPAPLPGAAGPRATEPPAAPEPPAASEPPAGAAPGAPLPASGAPRRPRPTREERMEAGRRLLDPSRLRHVLLIGSSTGGPAAVTALLKALPRGLRAAICITQHMPDGFTRAFAERLDRTTSFRVREAAGGDLLQHGDVWVAPGGRHLEFTHTPEGVATELTDAPPENSCRPAVDRMFVSAAETIGVPLTGVVLTGMGRDGVVGARAIKATGARMLVQDESSSVVWGMPGAVAEAGLADTVAPIPEIVEHLCQIIGLQGAAPQRGAK